MKRKRSVMERLEIQKKVLQAYLQLVQDGRLFPVDGNRPANVVSRDIFKIVVDQLEGSQFL